MSISFQGSVIINNSYPANLPAVFNIELFHNGALVSKEMTSIKRIPIGETKFSFKNFGIHTFNDSPGTEGQWKIKIGQQNADPADTTEIHIQIVPGQ